MVIYMKIKIFVLAHKKAEFPKSEMYIPLQVGAALNEKFGILTDDTGDNISAKNCYYSELTGHYYIWKQIHDCEIVGTCHYRRFLVNDSEQILNEEEIKTILKEYDLITTKKVLLNDSYLHAFSQEHNQEALLLTGHAIEKLYPDIAPYYWKLVNLNQTYFGNMFITNRTLYDNYCEFLFDVFSMVEKTLDLSAPDAYHQRVFGFVSEFLLYVYCTAKHIRVCECKVGMSGEKRETRETKQKLAELFYNKDADGAQQYLNEMIKKRPDILMEASDLSGELKLCMQIIITAKYEEPEEENRIFYQELTCQQMIQKINDLNHILTEYLVKEKFRKSGLLSNDELHLLKKTVGVSETAIKIAEKIITKSE